MCFFLKIFRNVLSGYCFRYFLRNVLVNLGSPSIRLLFFIAQIMSEREDLEGSMSGISAALVKFALLTNRLFHPTLDILYQTSEVTNFMACVPNFVVEYIFPFKAIATMATIWLGRLKKTSILFQVRYCILRAHSLVFSNLRAEIKGSRFESGCRICVEVSSLQ